MGKALRADAARNRQRLIEAAAEVFAARGVNATLDDIARHAGVNVATAYRNFSSKHELAREFLQSAVDKSVAIAEDAAGAEDPWQGLRQFLERAVELASSNRALVDMLSRAYGTEFFEQLLDRVSGPMDCLLARGRQAGVVREDIGANDFPFILEMLCSITSLDAPGIPDLPQRYISLVLAGLRPGGDPLAGNQPTREQMRAVAPTPDPAPQAGT